MSRCIESPDRAKGQFKVIIVMWVPVAQQNKCVHLLALLGFHIAKMVEQVPHKSHYVQPAAYHQSMVRVGQR